MIRWLPAAHLALSFIILIWDIALAGRIAQLRQATRPFAAVTGLAGLLLLPAVLIRLAMSTFATGRTVFAVDWIWPAVVLLVAIQATYAVSRRLVNLTWGIPILAYNVVVMAVEIVRYGVAHGSPAAAAFAGLLSAESSTLAVLTASTVSVTTPFFFLIPMISPAFPASRRSTATFRAFIAVVATVWVAMIAFVGSDAALKSAKALADHADDRIRERPHGDFRVGLRVFPDISSIPSPAAVKNDLSLVDTLGVRAVTVVFVPGVAGTTIDSIARVIGRLGDSVTVIVAIGYRAGIVSGLGRPPLDSPARLKTIDAVVRRMHPDILLPADDPTGAGARALGRLSNETWEAYITDAARTVSNLDRNVRIGMSISRFGTADSALYAWAAQHDSPVDVVGFSLFPEKLGLEDLVHTFEPAADRWMKTTPTTKDVWIFASGAYPLNFGEVTQERAIWQTLSWASDHPAIKGFVVYEAGDYSQARGLRAPNGRLRRAAFAVMRAVRGLKESIAG